MKTSYRTPLASTLLSAAIVSTSQAAVIGFTEDFTSSALDAAWSENGTGGSFDATNDHYQITNVNGGGGTKLTRNEGGTIGSFSS
ncbi:MAG: hypothetical protein QNK82_06720, partial [Akkermansiaceae bacterium]